MRAHEFITPQPLDEVISPTQQITPTQRAWLWNEFLRLLQMARKAAAESKSKPKTHKWAWKKPAKPRKPKASQHRRRKPRSGAIAPTKPQVLADPARAQRRVAALYRR